MKKVCSKCEGSYPATRKFFTSANNRSGLHANCKECLRKAGRLGVSKISENRRKRKVKDPCRERGKSLRQAMRERALKVNVPFDTDFFTASYLSKWLFEVKTCPCCGVELLQTYSFNRVVAKNSPSFDRVRPELGYVQGNVALICHRCNTLKSDFTLTDLQRMMDWVVAAQGTPQWQPPHGFMSVHLDTRHEVKVASYKEASEAIRSYWRGHRTKPMFHRNSKAGLVELDGEIIAFVSHDGRVWEGADRTTVGAKEIQVEQPAGPGVVAR